MEDGRNAANRMGPSMAAAAAGGGKMGSVSGYTSGVSDGHLEFEAASYTAGGGGRIPPTSEPTNDRRMMQAAGVQSFCPSPLPVYFVTYFPRLLLTLVCPCISLLNTSSGSSDSQMTQRRHPQHRQSRTHDHAHTTTCHKFNNLHLIRVLMPLWVPERDQTFQVCPTSLLAPYILRRQCTPAGCL